MEVVEDEDEFLSQYVSLSFVRDTLKCSPHDGDDHVEDDEERDERATEEYNPEDKLIFHIVIEAFCYLEVTQCQSVRVDQTICKANSARILRIMGVHIKDPKKECLSQHN